MSKKVTNEELAQAFTEAKKHLRRRGGVETLPQSSYICFALEQVVTSPLRVIAAAKRIITDRLKPYPVVDAYVRCELKEYTLKPTSPILQEFRHAWLVALIQEFSTDNDWHKGPPPSVGWWQASISKDPACLRWWNGKNWSAPCSKEDSKNEIARHSMEPCRKEIAGFIEWKHRPKSWPRCSHT